MHLIKKEQKKPSHQSFSIGSHMNKIQISLIGLVQLIKISEISNFGVVIPTSPRDRCCPLEMIQQNKRCFLYFVYSPVATLWAVYKTNAKIQSCIRLKNGLMHLLVWKDSILLNICPLSFILCSLISLSPNSITLKKIQRKKLWSIIRFSSNNKKLQSWILRSLDANNLQT